MRRPRGQVVVVGSLNADLTVRTGRLPRPGETVRGSPLTVAPGGKGANQAAAAARLGARVALLGAVGDDAHGGLLLRELERAGVDVEHVRRSGTATGTAVITVDERGENTIVLSAGANDELSPALLAGLGEMLRGADVLCLCFEVPMGTIVAAARAAGDAGVRVLLNPSPAAPLPDELLHATDLLIANATEAHDLLGAGGDLRAAGRWLRDRGVDAGIVTLGAEGAIVLQGDRVAPIPPTPITPVDTTGAGDAFTGAVAARLAIGDALVDAARFASRAAAWAATKPGAQRSYATLAELERWHPESAPGQRP